MIGAGTILAGVRGVIIASGVVGSLVWVWYLGHLIRHHRLVVFLKDLPLPAPVAGSAELDPSWPGVALIFAARDEAVGVEAATRSMLRASGDDPGLRVIAVDDRSTDGTGRILDRLAAAYPTLEVVHLSSLPNDWLGKTHALQTGTATPAALAARWLLFTDADVIFEPGAIRRAVAFAEESRVDHLAVAPGVVTRSVGERVFLCLFGLLFSMYAPLGWLSDRHRRTHVGIIAFNLVRAEAFRAIGGYRHLRMSVDDDMRLGLALKSAGYEPRLIFGTGAVSVRWQVGTWGMIRGIEKNFFAGLKFRLSQVLIVIIGVLTTAVAPFVGLFFGPISTRFIAGVGLVSLATILAASGRQSRIAWTYFFLLPIAAILILLALIRSVVITLQQHGVKWRNHYYPLPILKAHIRERDAWLSEVWRSTR